MIADSLADTEPLIRSLELGLPVAARMLGMSAKEFTAHRRKALAAVGLAPGGGRDVRLPMTADEQKRIAAIHAECWPEDPSEQIDFRIDLLRREFPLVCGLIDARKLYETHARQLFRASFDQIKTLRTAADEGRLASALADLTGALWTKSSSSQVPLTEAQRARLARIEAERWPDDPLERVEFRIRLLQREFPFARGLILSRHMNERNVRDLFKASFGQIRALMAAGRKGTLGKLLKNPKGNLWSGRYGDRSVSEEQRARVERIAGERWPVDPADWPALRMRLLRREYWFAWSMFATGRLNRDNIHQLFKLTRPQTDALIDASEQRRLWRLLNDDLWHPFWAVQATVPNPEEFAWPRSGGGRPPTFRLPASGSHVS